MPILRQTSATGVPCANAKAIYWSMNGDFFIGQAPFPMSKPNRKPLTQNGPTFREETIDRMRRRRG